MLFPVGSSFDTFFQIRPADPQICLDLSSLKLLSTSIRPHLNTKVDNMGLLTVVEDRPTPKAVYNWRVWACACVASFASCMIGYDR